MVQERPFLLPLLSMSVGLVLSDLTDFSGSAVILIPLLFSVLLSSLLRHRLIFTICCTILFFCWGLTALTPWSRERIEQQSIMRYVSSEAVVLEGVISGRPVVSPMGGRVLLHVDNVISGRTYEPVHGRVMIHVRSGDVTVKRGDRVRCRTKLTVPHRLGLPGEFDYGRYLRFQGVAASGRVATQDELIRIRTYTGNSPLHRADLAAGYIGDFVRTSISDSAISSVVTALVIGDQKRIPSDLVDAYTRSGVNHILSVSGFHVGIIAYFIAMLVLFIATHSETLALRFNLRSAVLFLSVPAMIVYLLLTGSAPATARSVIMLSLVAAALCSEREIDLINTLLMSACLLVVLYPPVLFDVSFQLSFLALWGIVVFVPPLMEHVAVGTTNWLRSLVQFVSVSLAASLATAIPALYTFHQTSLNGILANFLIVPLLGYGVVLAGFCAVPFMYIFPPVAEQLLTVAGWFVAVANWLVGHISRLPVLNSHGVTSLDMFVFLFFLSVLTFVRHRLVKVIICCCLPFISLAAHLTDHATMDDGRLHITMLSVGQGESLLVRLPGGATMLVDGGGYLNDAGRDFGERVVAPALHILGIKRIDYLVLTHPHPDHLGGLPYIARTMPVGHFLEAATCTGGGDEYQNLVSTLGKRNVKPRQLSAGDRLELPGKVSLHVFSPVGAIRGTSSADADAEMNEESLVFRLEYGAFSMLFTADAGFAAETRLLGTGTNLRSTVLKVGHHGSRYSTSEEFLENVAPEVALISAGFGNTFGLPSGETLSRLEQQGTTVFRTDRDGTVDLVSDGKSWSVATPYKRD